MNAKKYSENENVLRSYTQTELIFLKMMIE